MMNYGFRYNIDLPDDLSTILDQDFWIMEHIGPMLLSSVKEPVKFSDATWIFVKSGRCLADINLINYEITAPALVIIENSQILIPKYISPDFDASIMVLSKSFRDNLFLFISNMPLYTVMSRHPVVSIPDGVLPAIGNFFCSIKETMADNDNPYHGKAILFELATFVFKTLYKCYDSYKDEIISNQGRMSDQFLLLAQQNFREQRFLDFYAGLLKVTPKHLSRTVKKQTGFTAVEWIERFVILEAKVLLKSSNLNIQQISDELNFPSQSFFGKYFKKLTGMSPKEFRNS